MHRPLRLLPPLSMACAVTVLAAALAGPATAAPAATAATAVAWVRTAADAEVDAAFARARAQNRPLLLYWGAKWCPPCNQLQATLFNRQDFIERSRAFVAVYVDGDKPGAQRIASRFEVRGYPTLVVFNPRGEELTRLPGEADPAAVAALLDAGLADGRPLPALLADAQDPRRAAALSAADWRRLAWHSWDTDADTRVPPAERAALLARLASACPPAQADARARLALKALAARDPKSAVAAVAADPALRELARGVLADPVAARALVDVLANGAVPIAAALAPAGSSERPATSAAFDAALRRLQDDTTLSRADRLGALAGRVELARAERTEAKAPLPAALVAELREHVARDDREIRDAYERQAVVTGGAWVLRQAGLIDESDALLKANLARSHSAYYLMSQLAGNAKARGDKAGAIAWSAQAWEKSEGPATRLQWGATHLATLVELAPQDAARIERTAGRIFDEAAAQPDAFHQRSARSLQRVGRQLMAWNRDGTQAAALQRLQRRLETTCSRLPAKDPQREACAAVFRPGAAAGGEG